ncbi:MAG: lamin tail domain-containing protein [Sedimentisphaerales bacterium]|nr:lamin tail domain-containing protein [Sedimentisphaerales bacterium]
MRGQRRWYCLSVIACLVALGPARPGLALVVSEIMYHPVEDAITQDETLEFIELYNERAVSEELGNWAFTNGIECVFEPNTLLGPKQYLVIAYDPNAVKAAYGITNVVGPYTGRLNNDGERIDLSNANGGIVLTLRYDDDAPWPVSPDGTGHSLVLTRLSGDLEEASSWSASTGIGGTPGTADQVQVQPEGPTQVTLIDIGSPGRYFKGTEEPSPSGGKAAIAWTQRDFVDDPTKTEWLEGPNGYGYSNQDNELQYINTQLNDMAGNYISVYARLPFTLADAEIASFSQIIAEVHYDDAFVLYLNGTRVGDSGGLSGDPPAFSAAADSASDYEAFNLDLTSHRSLLVAGTNVLAIQAHNQSMSGSSDALAAPVLRAVVEPTSAGGDPRARLVINELLANSDASPGVDWIELYNPGPVSVDLGSLYLSDNRLNLLQYKLPAGTLKPGEFKAYSQGTGSSSLPFGLDFSGETVYLTAASTEARQRPLRVLDAVRYGVMPPDVTFGRYPNGSPYLTCLSSATRGAANAKPLVHDIVIHEIMYNHAMREDSYEYIELHNRGTKSVSLADWAFTDGIEYTFGSNAVMQPGSYLVVAKDPVFLAALYNNLTIGMNLVGPYVGTLDNHSERIRLCLPFKANDPQTGKLKTYLSTADEVTYYDGGRWPKWADGLGASLELRDPRSNNDAPDAWADSDESAKTTWKQFSYSIYSGDAKYTHDNVTIFDLMMLTAGEILLDDLQLTINSSSRLTNGGFESGESSWRILGNHIRSFVTTEDRHTGSRSLHVIATGHGDPGANRINQSISSTNAGNVIFSGWARWLRGSRFLLLRTTRETSPVHPPRPSNAFELQMPLNLGSPGRQNTAFVANRGPDILEIHHTPVVPRANEPIVVTARVIDNDGVSAVTLYYRSEGTTAFSNTGMLDNGSGEDEVSGDGIYTAVIPGASTNTMRAFYIEASDGSATTRFPTKLEPSADVPDRTCLIRVGDTTVTSKLAVYRIWMSDAVINAFRSRANLSNELLDCTFVYNDSDVYYNCGIRFRGSPFIRSGFGRDPRDRYAYRIEFDPDQRFHTKEEINLDNTEGNNRGPLQERVAYWFYAQMGLQYSRQEWVRLVINGRHYSNFDDVQKNDGDYVNAWFPGNDEGYLHKIDDYFEFNADGTQHSGERADEGLLYNAQHPLIPETYRWHFEKRSHPEDDNWQHLFDLAVAMNTPTSDGRYPQLIEAQFDPVHFTKVLAIRHAVGDWDSYGYRRGKNNVFYYALPEGKWYLVPWDIDFAFGAGDGANTSVFSVAGHFPEVNAFLNYSRYRQLYGKAFEELLAGPWQTSYGTDNPPTAFDRYIDENAGVLIAEGLGDGRRDQIKNYVLSRRAAILSQIPSIPPDEPPKPPVPPR